jgi:hypothetical protein
MGEMARMLKAVGCNMAAPSMVNSPPGTHGRFLSQVRVIAREIDQLLEGFATLASQDLVAANTEERCAEFRPVAGAMIRLGREMGAALLH